MSNVQRKFVEPPTENQQPSTRPSHNAYTIRGSGEQEYWMQIGAAWEHKDGKGLTIRLEALPIDGKVVIRDRKDVEPR